MITFLGKYQVWKISFKYMNFFLSKMGYFQAKKGIRIFELFTLTIHYIRISACSYSLTNTNYFCPNYSNNQIFKYRTKNPKCNIMDKQQKNALPYFSKCLFFTVVYSLRDFSHMLKQ